MSVFSHSEFGHVLFLLHLRSRVSCRCCEDGISILVGETCPADITGPSLLDDLPGRRSFGSALDVPDLISERVCEEEGDVVARRAHGEFDPSICHWSRRRL